MTLQDRPAGWQSQLPSMSLCLPAYRRCQNTREDRRSSRTPPRYCQWREEERSDSLKRLANANLKTLPAFGPCSLREPRTFWIGSRREIPAMSCLHLAAPFEGRYLSPPPSHF